MFNQIILIGNVSLKPEMIPYGENSEFCTFGLAVSRNKNKTDFFRVIVWGNYGRKKYEEISIGDQVHIVGPLYINIAEKDGKTYTNVEVHASKVIILKKRNHEKAAADVE